MRKKMRMDDEIVKTRGENLLEIIGSAFLGGILAACFLLLFMVNADIIPNNMFILK